ncbi:hypothetical protein CDL12_25972 [Handroanthus impetiginosus]|uniref:Ionotropic glutamate receptor C-terminal domain-containing protein n=1 Tax=Handroanthus impetiginosus TaxID=429701 RepID=A0A2G9G8J3_9LAMI|nr:hypothetical protein CDL12_25972 [Handroanthus impetiginosus]
MTLSGYYILKGTSQDTSKWRRFVFLHEDTADARQAQTYIHDILWENHLDVAYQTALSLQATDDQIIEGFVNKGFGWIVTSKTTNFLDSLDSSAIESAQIKHAQNWAEGVGLKQLDLARLRVSNSGSAILSKITSSKFGEFDGKFHLLDTYEILNVICRGRRQSNKTIFRGFCIDVFRAAVDKLPYEIPLEYIPFYNHHGNYSHLVHQVSLQDAAVGDITILSNRSSYVDFPVPYSSLGLAFVVKLDDKDLCACSFFLVGFIVWLVEHPINEEFQGPPAQQIGTALWFAALTLVYAPNSLFAVLVLTSSYTAKLSSLLTMEQIKLTKGDYIGYSANSFIPAISMSNLKFKDNKLKPSQQGSKEGGVDAMLHKLPYLKIFVARYPYDYAVIESSMITGSFDFAFPKGSTLGRSVSRAIAELREEGKLLQMDSLNLEYFFCLSLLSWIPKSMAVLIVFILLLCEKLSISYYLFAALARGKLMLILRYLHPRMVDIIDGEDAK